MCAGFGEITSAVPFDKWHCLLEVDGESCLVIDLVLADVKGRHLALRIKGACGGKADLAFCSAYVCVTHMYGPAVRCKRFVDLVASGLASMYPASDWSILLRAIMDISAHAFSLADRPRPGHLGHQCSHAPGRPILHLYLSSRRPRLETVDRVTSSLAPHIAQFLCSSRGPFLRPGPQNVDRVARRARSRPAVAHGLRRAPALPGRALTAPSTARGSSGSDACIVGPRQFEGASFRQDRPGDAGKLVGERDRQHVGVQPLLGGFDPGFEPITFQVLYPGQNNPCRLHKQNARVAIAAPRDFAEDRAVSRRDLLGHQSEPGAEVAAFGERVSSADR